MDLLTEYLHLARIYFTYYVTAASTLIVLQLLLRLPDYIFRKLLHSVAFFSILPLILCTGSWLAAALVELSFLAVIVVPLIFLERFDSYKKLLVEKGKHEVITSFLMLFSLITLFIVLFWGCLGPEYAYIAAAAIMAWGPGDAAAAIVGKSWGRHKLSGPRIEGIKSLEGTIAMGVTSFLCTAITLYFLSGLGVWAVLGISAVVAPVAALVELYTLRGLDTVTVPIASALILTLFAVM